MKLLGRGHRLPSGAVVNREAAGAMATRRDCFYGFAFAHPERDRGRIGALVTEAMRRLVDPLHTAP